mgnify:CR=1 FL=1
MQAKYSVDENGFYGKFGGAFIPEMLYSNVEELKENYLKIMAEPAFQEECNQLYKIQPAPPIMELTTDEQFCDGEWTYPIEVRGKRNIDECYFSAKDVGDLFELVDLQKQLTHTNSSYIEGVDYMKFLVPSNTGKKNIIRYYLTYNGVICNLSYLFVLS